MTSTCHSYAKINLYLDVLPQRPDGYHDIETIFQSIELHDTLHFANRDDDQLTLECDSPEVPGGTENLVTQAAELLRKRYHVAQGAEICLEKRIPVAAGLAGGSSNAAAALIGLTEVWNLSISHGELHSLALDLGSDVPFCLVGGTAVGSGRGEVIEPLPALPTTWMALVHPPMAVATATVYNSPHLKPNTATRTRGKTAAFDEALRRFAAGGAAPVVFNRMEEAVFTMHPELRGVKQALLDAGCAAAAMSGSGPTFFGLCDDEAHAREVAERLNEHHVTVTYTVDAGVAKTA